MSRQKLKLALGALVMAGAIGYLGFTGIRSGWVYYLDVDEFVEQADTQGRRARVHGVVSPEGLDARPAEMFARFDLAGSQASLPVEYRGAIPDMFDAGREVVVEGVMRPDGLFEADLLLTKCASKYEARAEPAAEDPGGSP